MKDYYQRLSDATGVPPSDLRRASIHQQARSRVSQYSEDDCARDLRTIAATDTQMFVTERAMMSRSADLLDRAARYREALEKIANRLAETPASDARFMRDIARKALEDSE